MIIQNYSRAEFMSEYYDYDNIEYTIPNSNYIFDGFYYFSYSSIPTEYESILIAFDEKDKNLIFGVIVYGYYGKGQEQAISYIDVNEKYQSNGISKELIIELNKHLNPIYNLTVSALSTKGKLCSIDKVFKKLITNTQVVLMDDLY